MFDCKNPEIYKHYFIKNLLFHEKSIKENQGYVKDAKAM